MLSGVKTVVALALVQKEQPNQALVLVQKEQPNQALALVQKEQPNQLILRKPVIIATLPYGLPCCLSAAVQ